MCGILGTIPATETSIFNSALDKLTHRGPDGFGIWTNTDSDVILGHRRLSILDTSNNGNQPMHYEEYSIIFNGEIYNFLEIRKELESKGFRFKSNSDTEVVLIAFKYWNEKCLLKFNGMWSMAIWNNNTKTMFLSRDRFGKKPLFYSFYDGKFIFGSEMKAITPFFNNIYKSKHFDWCKQNVFIYENTDKCLIQDINRFPPASYTYINPESLKKKEINIVQYWNTLENLIEVPEKYEDQVEMFKELFLDACKIRMRSDVPIGTSLSGGLDSSATICAMSHINNTVLGDRSAKDWQNAFVACFPGTSHDESKFAKLVVDYLGIDGVFTEINGGDDFANLYNYTYMTEELYITPPNPMIKTYQSVKNAGISVTLDGHGADELLSGYNYDFYEAIFDCGLDFKQIENLVKTRFGTIYEKSTPNQFLDNLKEICYFLSKVGAVNTMHKLNEIGLISNKHRMPVKRYAKLTGLSHFNSMLYDRVHNSVLPTLLRNYDRYSMTASVEVRMPFMDYRIVTFLMSIPWQSKMRNGYTKSILRDALKDIMPKEIVERKSKIGFSAPLNNWIQGSWKSNLIDMMTSINFKNSSVIDSKEVEKSINLFFNKPNSSFSEASNIWQSLVPFFWEQTMLKK